MDALQMGVMLSPQRTMPPTFSCRGHALPEGQRDTSPWVAVTDATSLRVCGVALKSRWEMGLLLKIQNGRVQHMRQEW